MFIEADVKELELSDIVKICYRPIGNDIGETIPIVGFLSRKYNGNGKLYLKSVDPRYRPGRWGEKEYSIKKIEYLKKISPLGKKGIPMNTVII
jgi:hypothetical protein